MTRSNQDQEWSFSFQLNILINNNDFLELSFMADFGSNIIIVIRLSNLISELTMGGHGFELNQQKITLRFIVAPDSKSPNLKNPLHIWVSLLKNLQNLFLNSGNFVSQG